ncbi:MAG: hypothetical protein ACK4NR_06575 [Micavibrio sp.]
MWHKLALSLLLLTISLPAVAEPYTYSPENCEFTITLPSEPLMGKKCNPDDPTQCHEILSFTKVFDLSASLTVDVICNPAEDGMYERYTGDVMRTTLIAMAGRGKLDEYETGFTEKPEAKIAYLLGYGKKGDQDLIYNGQLWIGKKSVFSLEAEIAGEYITGADEVFATILQSVTYKDWKTAAPADVAAQNEEAPAPEAKAEPAAASQEGPKEEEKKEP